MSKQLDWITLDYLEIYCRNNHLVIGCRSLENELWISPTGSHPTDLTSDKVKDLLRKCTSFELRTLLRGQEEDAESSLPDSAFLSREELQVRLSRLLN